VGWIRDKSCHVTIDTGASLTIAGLDIVAGQPERNPIQPYVLQMASGKIIPVLKEPLVELTLGHSALQIWMFVAEITKEFILGQNVIRASDAPRVATGPRSGVALESRSTTTIIPPYSLASDGVIPTRCKRVVTARLEGPLEAVNGLMEPNFKTSRQGLCIARTMVRAGGKVPVRITNVSNRDQMLAGGTALSRCELVTWAAPIDGLEL
jgi:hypothetical protein